LVDLRIIEIEGLAGLEKSFNGLMGECRDINALGVDGLEGRHEMDSFGYGLLAQVAVFDGMETSFVFEQCAVTLDNDSLGVLFVPMLSRGEE